MKTLICISILLAASLYSEAYVTYDGKQVPPFPIPAGSTVYRCSTFVSFYLNLRNHMQPNTVFLLADATYDFGTISINITADNVALIGESGDPSKVILVSNGFENNNSVDQESIKLSGVHRPVFANITISECRCNAVKYSSGPNSDVLFHNVRFINNGERSIKGPRTVVELAPGCTIRYCHFENTKIPSSDRCTGQLCDGEDDGGNYIAGMDIMGYDQIAIHDNVFLNIKGASGGGRAGVFLWTGGKNSWTMRNTFIGCDRSIAHGNYSSSSTSDSNAYIMNNFIVPGAGNAIELYWTRNVRIFNNTLCGPNTGSIIYQNASLGGSNLGCEIKNNLIYGSIANLNATPPDTLNNLIVTRSQSALLSRWLVDNANGDLHIKSDTCRPVNRGISLPEVTVDWDNAPRTGTLDIGADEFGNGSLIQSFDPRLTNLDDVYLSPAQPNPFNPHTLVQYGITNAGSGKPFECAVFSTSGKLIRMLKRGAAIAGNYALQWDAKDDNGVQVASGAYVIKLVAGGKSVTTNVVFMK